MKRVKAMMGFLIFFILGVSIVASEAADIQAFTDREIKLGLIMAMSGPMAPSGAAMNLSIKDYLRHVNEEGGIHGRKIKLIIEDGQFKIPKAMAAYNKLWFREKIFTLLGCLGCGQNVALFPQFKEHNIVTIPLSSCKEFTHPFNPNLFMINREYSSEVDVMFDYVFHEIGDKNPRIAFVYPDQRYGKGALKAARERARQYGIKLTAEVVLNHGVVDASSQVMALKKAKADYVFICGHISQMPALYKSMKTYSYDPYVFGVHLICNESIVPRLGEQTKKFIGIHFLSGWNSDAPGIKLAKNLVKKYNTDLTGKPTGFYTYGMGVIMVMVEGLKRAGRDLTLDKLRASLETFRGWDAYGVLAPLTFTSTNHMGPTKLSVFKTDPAKKQLVQVGWRTPLKLGEK